MLPGFRENRHEKWIEVLQEGARISFLLKSVLHVGYKSRSFLEIGLLDLLRIDCDFACELRFRLK